MSSAKEAEFHGVLFTRLRDYIAGNDTVFESPVAEKTTETGFADIYIPSPLNGDIVIEVKRDDIYPREHDVVKQARNYADELNADFFATCNSNDLFLFEYHGEYNLEEIDFYYLDLRETTAEDFVPQFVSVVRHVYEEDELPVQFERDRIVGILRSFHSSIWPTYKALAEKKYGANERFTQAFARWIQENDYASRDRDEQFELAAKQYAYLLTNRILFYEVIREKTRLQYEADVGGMITPIGTESGFPLDPLAEHTTTENLHRHIQNQFQRVIEEVDYRPIFEEQNDLFGEYPQNRKTLRTLEDFITNIESERVTDLDEDLLGEIYEELIPAGERKALGQFYTHPKIAETLCRWTLRRPHLQEATENTDPERAPRVLDPACGSGTFTVEAYNVLRELYPDVGHQKIVNSLVAIDINRFPLHLTALNLSSRNIREETDYLHIFHDSFFNIDPETSRLVDTRIDAAEGEGEKLGLFDAVVGNPPYIRQEDLYPDKDHFRAHLSTFGRSGYTTYKDGSKSLSKRSDAYIYFITHATQFLNEGGRLGFIVPTKWMTTKYGESFQQFLYDHYKVHAVVGFSLRAFEDALVDTALLMIERCSNETKREETTTAFVRIKETMEAEDVLDAVAADYTVPEESYMEIRNRPAYRVAAVEQSYLVETGPQKLSPYVRAPVEFIQLLEHPALTPLGELGETHRGVMTGANDFFFVDAETLQSWDIDDRFLHPAIKSIRDAKDRVIRAGDSEKYLFDIHDYVEQVKRDMQGLANDSRVEQRVKDALSRDGYDETRRYIEWGEREGYHERRSCASRPVWFDLGERNPPEILHPKFYNERVYVIWNPDRLMPSNAVDCVSLDEEIDEEAMLGVLNSTVYKALLETWGRAEGGGALQLMTYEVSTVPVVDVRQLDTDGREALATANEALVRGEDGAQQELDLIVLDALGVDVDLDRFYDLYDAMVERRIRSGDEVEVLVERLDELEQTGTQTFQKQETASADLSDFM
ncbi:N-6 DNA methylase [Halobacteriales archaeon QS_1_68_17]|nr:MAG: N-6 DNA methylase [Halobacteriales archaeon QS_1_68_17]